MGEGGCRYDSVCPVTGGTLRSESITEDGKLEEVEADDGLGDAVHGFCVLRVLEGVPKSRWL